MSVTLFITAGHGPAECTQAVAGVTAVAREDRSQHRNKSLALMRLQTLLSARAAAEEDARKSTLNHLHHHLERGNPTRCFTGPGFTERGIK